MAYSKRKRYFWYLVGLLILAISAAPFRVQPVLASGVWGGQDVLHVPMSWCIVDGSPADTNPNIAGDTATDDLIWRRHERPTDTIFLPQAGISLRSAINNAWTTLNYPIITDPDTTLGTPGDMRGENVNTNGIEFNQLINSCDAIYASPQYGRAGIGVTAVNAGLFHNDTGNYVGVIGWGGCNQNAAGNCVAPYDGRIVVVDNHYLFPTVADRTFPPSPLDTAGNLQFSLTDPLDQLTGHEVAHALSEPHRTNNQALMNPGQTDNNGDGQSDNIGLNAAEVNDIRQNAQNVPGLEIDPEGQFTPGRFVVNRQVDEVLESNGDIPFPSYLDLASVKLALDQETHRVYLDQQLFGLIPGEGEPVEAWYLVDSDGAATGISPDQLKEIGAPETRFEGTDFVAHVTVAGGKASGQAWRFANNELIQVDEGFLFELQTLILYPHFSPLSGRGGPLPEDIGHAVHHIINMSMDATPVGLDLLGKTFRIQTMLVQGNFTDRLDDTPEERGTEFILEIPTFPHCFLSGDATPGETTPVTIDGLHPNSEIYGSLGTTQVFIGMTDAAGGGTIDFPIPVDTTEGFHLVTIGLEGTGLTADCTVHVLPGGTTTTSIPADRFALLTSLEDLLRRQSTLLDKAADIVNHLTESGALTTDQSVALTHLFLDLTLRQAELLNGFETLIREAAR